MKQIYILFGFLLLIYSSIGQELTLQKGNNSFSWQHKNNNTLVFENSISQLQFKSKSYLTHTSIEIDIEGYGFNNAIGAPALPVLRKLVELPLGADVEINIISKKEKEYDLKDLGIYRSLYPTQQSVYKSQTDLPPFEKDNGIYLKNAYYDLPLVSFDILGMMRSTRLGRLNISPISYNPVTQKIKVVYDISFELIFKNADFEATNLLKEKTFCPFNNGAKFDIIYLNNPSPKSNNLTKYPVTYVIVSDPAFQVALQPFIQWKTQKGFKVIEAYTNNPLVGNTTTSIKNYLQNLYNSATPNNPAFSFALLVGDVAQIPSFSGNTGPHVSDLYYFEYTNDIFPEVYYGRFSANTVAQLQPQIDKTIEYEKFLMANSSFLSKSLLVAGDDANFAISHGNSHINYINTLYLNSTNNNTPYIYLYPASTSAATQIKQDFNNGVGIVNYTAHCSSSGWAGPYFTTYDVPNLSNAGMYPLMIGNCCQSAKFDITTCFAEAMLRAANKGAIGYIGGSNNTYWNEDYWWAVGYKSVVANPVYSSTQLGSFDRLFHTHNEPFEKWFPTQGQIISAGNLAVSQSNSHRENYYWEIYHLMGDPSLMPYLLNPPALNISYNNNQMLGINNIQITTEPYTYVGISHNNVLHGAGLSDVSGHLDLQFTPFTTPTNATIVATKQNRKPKISTINFYTPNGPYVIYDSHIIKDSLGNNNNLADYNEHIFLDMSLKNIGSHTAHLCTVKVSSSDPYITITDSLHFYGTILSNSIKNINLAFAFTVHNFIYDQHEVIFNVEITDSLNNTWTSNFPVILNAPKFVVNSGSVNDNIGNSNGLFDIGETVNFEVETSNIGHSNAYTAHASLTSLSNYITVNTPTLNIGAYNAAQSILHSFNITASNNAPMGTTAQLAFNINDGPYIKNDTFIVVIGELNSLIMKDTVIHTCMMHFYDPGGPNNDYNIRDIFTTTFRPAYPNSYLKATFLEFDVEANSTSGCFDFLRVYNGINNTYPVIGEYCGNTLPSPVFGFNPQGALTFYFFSDNSVTKPGWKILIECISLSDIEVSSRPAFSYSLYPNPSNGNFNLSINNNTENIEILVYDMQGRLVHNEITSGSFTDKNIDLSFLSKGSYFMKLSNSKNTYFEKLTILN